MSQIVMKLGKSNCDEPKNSKGDKISITQIVNKLKKNQNVTKLKKNQVVTKFKF